MRKNSAILLFALFALLLACEKTTPKSKDEYLSGKWVEHIPEGSSYFAATLHTFVFNKDSFYAKFISWTDAVVIIPSDPCPESAYEETYIRGTYELTDDSICFSGKLCDSLYQHLRPTCKGVSDYKTQFKFTRNDTAIILNADRASDFGYGIVLKKE